MRVAVIVLMAVMLSGHPAAAHGRRQNEQGILQVRHDGTSLLYEVTFPEGPASARWFWRADVNHNGRVEAGEFERLAADLAQELSRRVHLSLEGNLLPWRVLDAKVRASSSRPEGKLSAMVLLGTREMPPGRRKIELRIDPLVRSTEAAQIAFESSVGEFVEVVGGRPVGPEGGSLSRPIVGLASGERCLLLVEIEKPSQPR